MSEGPSKSPQQKRSSHTPLRWRVGGTTAGQPPPSTSPSSVEEREGSAAITTGNSLWLATPGSSLEQPRSRPLPAGTAAQGPMLQEEMGIDGDLDRKPDVFRMRVHLFGATSSPACANYGLKHLAQEYSSDYPLGAQFVMKNFYVDDGVTSVVNTEDAIKLATEARMLCAKGGLRLHKFMSNDAAVMESLPASERAEVKNVEFAFDEALIERTLGIQWQRESDDLKFGVHVQEQPATRRNILSTVASVYDPLGFIAPVLLSGKRILQEMCKHGTNWDDPMPPELMPRAIARLLRWVDKDKSNHLATVIERKKAECVIVKALQRDTYKNEIHTIGQGRNVSQINELYALDPFIEEDGVLRVGLGNFASPYAFRHPMVIPKSHPITKMIIADCHEKVKHQGKGFTMNEIRANGFWIPGLNKVVASYIRQCVICRKHRRPTEEQRMADLPSERFWSRWRKEYLANITIRQRWHVPRRNLQIGDIVMVKDEDLPRNEWRLRRVVETYANKDGGGVEIPTQKQESSGRKQETLVQGELIQTVFLLGLPSRGNITEQQEHISKENLQYHDLIQSDFVDSYINLTIKTMVIMDWLATRCPNVSYTMKIDSDMFPNVENLVTMLKTPGFPKKGKG
ncbi:Beta-1,3-galactosyltransferase 2 [Merluccius polli]|uniref:Beta-1,3-galactosyltransferase 2 n=1 Tax=Merluccius polli TaxID=89951 RepID=A0AA47NLP7_MERPO|nr:Beta-1,3-galactosyltransferase 2 [Merluccius polli]